MAIVVPIVTTFEPAGLNRSIREIEKASGGWAKAGRTMESLAVPAAAIGVGLAAGAKSAADAASALGESTNAVGAVFGKASDKITAFGATSAKSVGLSQRAFQELATSTGSLLQNFGYSASEAGAATIELSTRAADMASVFNTDVATAMEAINAGLRGESEPLRKFGVNLNDATLKAKALEMGLYSGKGALSDNAKAAAAQAVIMEQSAKTAGDFARTSDGAANSQRIATASAEDLAAGLGKSLLPAWTAVLRVATSIVGVLAANQGATKVLVAVIATLVGIVLATNAAMKVWEAGSLLTAAASKVLGSSVLSQTASWVGNTAGIVANRIASAAARAASVAMTAAQWALNAALTANPIGLVVAAIALLIGGLVLAYKKSDTFRDIVDSLGRVLRTVLGSAISGVSGAIGGLVDWMRDAWNWAGRLADKIGALASKLNPLKSAGSVIGSLFGRAAMSAPTVGSVPSITRAGGSRTVAVPSSAPSVSLTDEQAYRALVQLLTRGDTRNGRPAMVVP